MDKKLTLKLDLDTINSAKQYAKKHGTSLSKIVEYYFNLISAGAIIDDSNSPLVKELSGIIELPENYDYKKDYTIFLLEKYKK